MRIDIEQEEAIRAFIKKNLHSNQLERPPLRKILHSDQLTSSPARQLDYESARDLCSIQRLPVCSNSPARLHSRRTSSRSTKYLHSRRTSSRPTNQLERSTLTSSRSLPTSACVPIPQLEIPRSTNSLDGFGQRRKYAPVFHFLICQIANVFYLCCIFKIACLRFQYALSFKSPACVSNMRLRSNRLPSTCLSSNFEFGSPSWRTITLRIRASLFLDRSIKSI